MGKLRIVTFILTYLLTTTKADKYEARVDKNGNARYVNVDTTLNPILMDEFIPNRGPYILRVNQTRPGDLSFLLCRENSAPGSHDYGLPRDQGTFTAISRGVWQWDYDGFGVSNKESPYTLLVDEGSDFFGTGPNFLFVDPEAFASRSTVTFYRGPVTALTLVTTTLTPITTSAVQDTPTAETQHPTTKSDIQITSAGTTTIGTPPPTSTSVKPSDPELPASSSAPPDEMSSKGRPPSVSSSSADSVTSPNSVTSPGPPTISNTSGSSSAPDTANPPVTSDSSHTSSAALIGGAVGGALGGVIFILLGALFFILRRRKKRKATAAGTPSSDYTEKPELDNVPSPRAELDNFRRPTELPSPRPPTELSGAGYKIDGKDIGDERRATGGAELPSSERVVGGG